MYLLDTNALSELEKASPHPKVRTWVNSQPSGLLFTSVIVVSELETGVRLMERRDEAQGRKLRRWLNEEVRETFAERILDVDLAVALQAAAFPVPDPSERHDALIGATAAVHGFTIVTRNVGDFDRFGVPTVNPWESEP